MWIKAFNDVAKDPEFIAAATKSMGMVPAASDGVAIRKAFTDFIAALDGLGIRDHVRARYKEINK
jgi:hypothetical protein